MGMSEECKQWRKERRAELLSRRRAITDAERSQWNASITRLLIEGFPFLRSMTLGFYWPFQGEFDPRFATRHFRKHSATTALPVVVQKGAPLQFREWYPGAIVVKGVFDLPMPSETRVVRPQALLIPPVGFDAQGYRLGYGGGYFDRTLAALTPKHIVPGHGRVCDLDQAQRETGDYYAFLVDTIGAAAREMEPMDETLSRHADLPAFRHLENYDSLHRGNMNRAFTEFETQ